VTAAQSMYHEIQIIVRREGENIFYINNIEFNILLFADDQVIIA
jgi:sRNA-binding carbon storage regulator CsrA